MIATNELITTLTTVMISISQMTILEIFEKVLFSFFIFIHPYSGPSSELKIHVHCTYSFRATQAESCGMPVFF